MYVKAFCITATFYSSNEMKPIFGADAVNNKLFFRNGYHSL